MRTGSYTEIKGNLLALAKEGDFDIIAHGCNCQKIMGAGIALQIAREFPEAYLADKNDERLPFQRLGCFTHYLDDSLDLFIVNLYTQFNPGANFDPLAFELGLKKLTMFFSKESKIGLPMIGAGIGGGDWEQIKEIIQRVLSEYDVTIVIYDK